MARSVLISNPPYNLKWQQPMLAGMQARFKYGIPPESNANFAFVLTGLEMVTDRAVYLLPNNVLTSGVREEKDIRRNLIKNNLLSAVITLPGNMFESTNIATCILVLDKHKDTQKITFIDLRKQAETEVGDQTGQFGGASHTGRTYHKNMNILTSATMQKATDAIQTRQTIAGFCASVSMQTVLETEDCSLSPSQYIEQEQPEEAHRPYKDIITDINRVIETRNTMKLVINESALKSLGWAAMYDDIKQSAALNRSISDICETHLKCGPLKKEDYFTTTKSAVIKVECKDTKDIPFVLRQFLQGWAAFVHDLNKEENRLLAESSPYLCVNCLQV
jgi:type I restriction-modification system DNA methylase subunit